MEVNCRIHTNNDIGICTESHPWNTDAFSVESRMNALYIRTIPGLDCSWWRRKEGSLLTTPKVYARNAGTCMDKSYVGKWLYSERIWSRLSEIGWLDPTRWPDLLHGSLMLIKMSLTDKLQNTSSKCPRGKTLHPKICEGWGGVEQDRYMHPTKIRHRIAKLLQGILSFSFPWADQNFTHLNLRDE